MKVAEGDLRVCGVAFLRYFWCSFAVISYLNSRYCGFKTLSGFCGFWWNKCLRWYHSLGPLERSASGSFANKREPSVLFYNASGFILWPPCTCGFGIREKIWCGLWFFGAFLCGFAVFRPPYAPLLISARELGRRGRGGKEKGGKGRGDSREGQKNGHAWERGAFLREKKRFTQFRKKKCQRKLDLALTPSVENQRICSLYCPGKHPHLSACKNSNRLLKFPLQHHYNVKQVVVGIRKIISKGYSQSTDPLFSIEFVKIASLAKY